MTLEDRLDNVSTCWREPDLQVTTMQFVDSRSIGARWLSSQAA
ncbi:hypothetical protein SZ00_06160 (plasmid) [Rhodococcus sp. AD45]|nr:hypothetical protein SZ00_06069 [Rhodococcus sp. AD45]KJF19233.1 hypothetical protein SZ00_06160 [Rhodococcus sp. AD45]